LRDYVGLAVIAGLYFAIAWFLIGRKIIDGFTSDELNYSAMSETAYRIHLFAKGSGRLPIEVHELPKQPNSSNRILDAWGRPLIYRVSPDGTLVVGTLGKDGLPGGGGEDKDHFETYRYRDASGRFLASDELWIVEQKLSRD